jgi:hypothetical protein
MLRQLKVFSGTVIPAQAGIQIAPLDSRLRGNEEQPQFQGLTSHQPMHRPNQTESPAHQTGSV